MPRNGFWNAVRMLVNAGLSARGSTAPLIILIPTISTAKPTKIEPRFFFESFLQNIRRIMPIKANTAENDEGLSSFIIILSPSIPERLKIQDVIVVPTFAPIMMPIACLSFIIPEFTKPTTITVVADDD